MTTKPDFSKWIRRVHMYLALFLIPWVTVYALSTILMNHAPLVRNFYKEPLNQFHQDREIAYDKTFPPDTDPRAVGEQVLNDIGQPGTFFTQGDLKSGRLSIVRQDAIRPTRITYSASEHRLVIERQTYTTPSFLMRLHTRHGYNQPYLEADAWAFMVDAVVVAMVFWVASGLWMWWEIKPARRWGAAFALGGAALFGLFLFAI